MPVRRFVFHIICRIIFYIFAAYRFFLPLSLSFSTCVCALLFDFLFFHLFHFCVLLLAFVLLANVRCVIFCSGWCMDSNCSHIFLSCGCHATLVLRLVYFILLNYNEGTARLHAARFFSTLVLYFFFFIHCGCMKMTVFYS